MFHKDIAQSACAVQPEGSGPHPSLRLLSSDDLRAGAEQAKLVRKIQRARSRRTDFLSTTLFGEPAWDMLLELFASAIEQKRVTVGELCIASNVPQTTALRWIDVLVREELVTRRSDPLDARRVHLELMPSAYEAMRDYADQLSGTLRTA
jgi:hypothetical protein